MSARWRFRVTGIRSALSLAFLLSMSPVFAEGLAHQPLVVTKSKAILKVQGLQFRDADGDGALSPFEDWRLPPSARAADLVGRMTAEEKVGTLVHSTMPGLGGMLGRANNYDFDQLRALIEDKKVTSFITRLGIAPAAFAEQNNRAQALAEASRLGIPLTISTDPRNHFQYVLGAGESAQGTTQWPEALGFAALGDLERMKQFGAIARREYRAVGMHMALSPQLDLLTEPRWPRGVASFGSDARVVSDMGRAYVEGFQGGKTALSRDGVLTVAKHWVGYGAQPEGFDGHNFYGRFAEPGAAFDQHVDGFRGALEAGTGGIMPAYPIVRNVTVNGQPVEQVGPGFSKLLLTNLLRGEFGFKGLILSDWAITLNCSERCVAPTAEQPQRPQDIGTSWGVENLSVKERYVLGLQAGIDQFGGTDDVGPLLEALRSGTVEAGRVDESVMRILEPKFVMGLFENPYVDPAMAGQIVGAAQDVALAELTQREAQVLLKNDHGALPFKRGAKVWLFGMDPEAAQSAGLVVVDKVEQADFAIIRAESPSEMLHPHHFFGSRQKEGRLDFRDGDPAYDALKAASAKVPTVLAIFLDRPAVLTNVNDKAAVILANFGASDAAVLDVLLGRANARGKLPLQLPRSMDQVVAQHPGLPDDIADPLFPRGAGLLVD